MPRLAQFALFFGIVLAILGGIHFYLWARLVRDPGLVEPWRRLFTIGLCVAAAAVPVSLLLVRARPSRLGKEFVFLGMTWLGVSFFLFSALLAADLLRLAAAAVAGTWGWLRHEPDIPADPVRRQLLARAVAGGAVLAVGGASAVAMRTALQDPEIHEVAVGMDRLPRSLSGFSIAQISDLHVGPTIGEAQVRRVVQATNDLRPDLIAVTGDLVDGSVASLGRAVAELGALRARHGVYFVTGNHEYYSGVDEWIAFLRGLGMRVLRNERVAVGDGGDSFDLAGIDDWHSRGLAPGHGPDLRRALEGRDPERSLLLLAHQPKGVEAAIRSGVELQLSGHTHGGQTFPFNLVTGIAYPYLRGLYRHEEPGRAGHVFVSRGTGYWGPPMRLGNPPEIARIVLTAGA